MQLIFSNFVTLLAGPNNGNAAAKELLKKEFAASADAAYLEYASTLNVKMPEYTRMILIRSDSG